MAVIIALVAALLGDFLGGLIPLHPRMRNISLRYILALASGTVISAAFFELLPEASVEANWALLGLGFFTIYLIDKGLSLHQCGEDECEITGVSWVTVLGMASDNIIDGAGIAVAYMADPHLAIIVALAIITHEIPQGITTTLVMKKQGYRLSRILLMLSIAAVMYPLGASLGNLIPVTVNRAAIAFVAGVFVYTGASALMTEAHRQFNKFVLFFMLTGAAIALGLKFVG